MEMSDLSINKLQTIIYNLGEEKSDRACAVLGFATLDALVERVLRAWLHPNIPEELFEGSGALSTSIAKIDMAYSLGLISENERRDLHLLRKIRNEFAHAFDHDLVFSTPAISNRLSALSLPALLETNPAFRSSDPRYRFYLSVGILSTVLSDLRLRGATHRAIPDEIRAT